MRAKYTLPIILILTLLVAILFRISSNETGTIEYVELKRNTTCLGTFGTFIIIADSTNANAIMNSVDSLVRHLEFETGIFSDGELNRLNSTGIIILSDCSEDMRFLLEQSLYIAGITDSLFDPSLGALTELWGFPQNPHLPDSSEIDSVLRTSGVSALEISNDIIRMPREMKLDLGAIAKGYVVDRAYDLALSLAAEGVLIEIGGEIRCGSTDNIARIWTIALRNPCTTGILDTYEVSNGAFATSGTYESSFESNGVKYSHIINPHTGYPEHDVLSVTVFAKEAYIADALATALAVGGASLTEVIPDSLYSRIIIISETADDSFEMIEFMGAQ